MHKRVELRTVIRVRLTAWAMTDTSCSWRHSHRDQGKIICREENDQTKERTEMIKNEENMATMKSQGNLRKLNVDTDIPPLRVSRCLGLTNHRLN